MHITPALMQHLRALWARQAWAQLDAEIAYADALAGIHPELCHFKVMAMANMDALRLTDAFVQLLQARLQAGQHRPLYLGLLAETLIALKRYAAAIEPLQQLVQIQPDSPKLFDHLAHCAERLGHEDLFSFAKGRFELSLGKELSRRFCFADAVPYLRNAHGRPMADPRTGWLYGQALLLTRNAEAAKHCLDQYAAGDVCADDASLIRLEIALNEQDTATAASLAQAILQRQPANIDALRALALIEEMHLDLQGAVIRYRQILALYPFDIHATLKAVQIDHQLADRR